MSEAWLRGRVCLVTGATSGIGLETARGLAARGATVVLAARSRDKGERARRSVESDGRGPLDLIVADLAVLEQVEGLARAFGERYGRLHVLVNNAGLYTRRRTVTPDGLEMQFAVNHLAPFLLTARLLSALEVGGREAGAPSRVVTVSSEAHRRGRIAFDDLQGERDYSGWGAYCQSKLANLLFTKELVRRVRGRGIAANAVHPGVVGTKLLFGGWAPLRLLKPFIRTPAEGARTPLHVATSEALAAVTGAYFVDQRPTDPAPQALDDEAAGRLWRMSEKLSRLRPDRA